MNLTTLAWHNITGSSFRSWVVAMCALLVAAFVLSTTLIMRGAENSLRLTIQRLGADIVVVPQGAEGKVESALLMGMPANVWMPASTAGKLRSLEGVDAVSPQLYLSTLKGASCCSVPEMFLVAYEPETDFTVQPWLKSRFGGGLRPGEAVGGQYVSPSEDDQQIKLYGSLVTLKANLEATGTGLDQTMFLTFDTAHDVARRSVSQAEKPLVIPEDAISALMVKVKPGADPHDVAVRILQQVPGATPIASPDLFQAYRKQMTTLLRTILVVVGITWVLSVALIGLVFSMAANEQRRELGVLRALGATRSFVLRSLLLEAGILALTGGAIGIGLAVLATFLFRQLIIVSIGVPFLFPSLPSLIGLVLGGVLVALLTVSLAALLPAYHISRQEPAVAMRE